MKLTVRLPYIKWRNGRPRFEPGPRMRRIGMVGQDLKHDDGRWFSAEEASLFTDAKIADTKAAESDLANHRVLRPPRGRRSARPSGFVYFLWSGDHVKIGYSTDPLRRLSDLTTSLPHGVRSLVCVPGTPHDERRLHHLLRAQRRSGEWFAATIPVLRAMQDILARGTASAPSVDYPTNANKSDAVRQNTIEIIE